MPIKIPKSKLWKMKIFAWGIIILHICTKNRNHMMYVSWDTKWDRHNYLSFWAIFNPFLPLTIQNNQNFKIKIWSWDLEHNRQNFCHSGPFLSFSTSFCPRIKVSKTWTTHLNILSFYKMRTINDSHMMYSSWDMKCNRQNFLISGRFFALLSL